MAPKEPSYMVSLCAGACAGTSVDVTLFPIDTLKTRMQSPMGFARAGGFKGVYNGLFAAASGSAPAAALFFATYESVKHKLTTDYDEDYHFACYMASSSCGEVAACWIRVPTENVKQKVQAGIYKSTAEALAGIKGGVKGYKGFYVGYATTIMREIPFSFIQFPIYEGLKKKWARWQACELKPYQSALCGSVGGGFSAALTTPFDVVKTRLMLGKDKSGVEYVGTLNTIKRIHREGGLKRFFSGVGPRTIWMALGGCVFFGAYETCKAGLEDMQCADRI